MSVSPPRDLMWGVDVENHGSYVTSNQWSSRSTTSFNMLRRQLAEQQQQQEARRKWWKQRGKRASGTASGATAAACLGPPTALGTAKHSSIAPNNPSHFQSFSGQNWKYTVPVCVNSIRTRTQQPWDSVRDSRAWVESEGFIARRGRGPLIGKDNSGGFVATYDT